jgi:hypothetical protein
MNQQTGLRFTALRQSLQRYSKRLGQLGEVAPPMPAIGRGALPGTTGAMCVWLSLHRPQGPWLQACHRHFQQMWWVPIADFQALGTKLPQILSTGGAQVLVVDLASVATGAQAWRHWSRWRLQAEQNATVLCLYTGDAAASPAKGPFVDVPLCQYDG